VANFLSKIRRVVQAVADALMAGEHARDRELDESWTGLHRRAGGNAALRLIQVRKVYQKATTGTKAIVVHRSKGATQDTWFDGPQQDAWFYNQRVQRGSILLVRESSGWGPHNHDPNVLYVRLHDVVDELPPVTESAVNRHRARTTRTPGHRP